MLDEIFLEHLLEGVVAVRQPTRRLEGVETGDEVALDGGVELFPPRGAPLSPKVALVTRLIFEVASTGHGAADKRPIPAPTISKGEPDRCGKREKFALKNRGNQPDACGWLSSSEDLGVGSMSRTNMARRDFRPG